MPMPDHVQPALGVPRAFASQLSQALVLLFTMGRCGDPGGRRCPRAWVGMLGVAAAAACTALPAPQAGGLRAGMSRAEVEGALGEPDGMQQVPGRVGYQYLARPGTAAASGDRYAVFADGRLVEWGSGAVRAEAGPGERRLVVTPVAGAPPASPRPEAVPSTAERAAAPARPAALTALVAPEPAMATLPAEIVARVHVRFPAGNSGAENRAGEVARLLRGKGLTVTGPAPVAPAGWAAGIDYYFVDDREAADRVARAAGGALGPGRLVAAPRGTGHPRPGTVIVVVSDTN